MIILERFEEDSAVIEKDGVFENIPKKMIDENVREGDILVMKNGKYEADKEASKRRREEILRLQKSLWE